jgi:hypothetical protein
MLKLSLNLLTIIAAVTALFLTCLHTLSASPALSEILSPPVYSPTIIATASTAPNLVSAKLRGKPVHVLYMTRVGDTVLVRCYPGYLPAIKIQSMGSKSGMETPKEGVMTCKAAA